MKIPDIFEIAVAWKRSAAPTEEQQQVAEQRLSICDACPQKTWKPLVRSYVCGACGCPISKKIYSPRPGPEACPEARWDI